jgi:hypothetical protein
LIRKCHVVPLGFGDLDADVVAVALGPGTTVGEEDGLGSLGQVVSPDSITTGDSDVPESASASGSSGSGAAV